MTKKEKERKRKIKQITESHGEVFIYEIEMGFEHIVKCHNVTELTILIINIRECMCVRVCVVLYTATGLAWLGFLSFLYHFAF